MSISAKPHLTDKQTNDRTHVLNIFDYSLHKTEYLIKRADPSVRNISVCLLRELVNLALGSYSCRILYETATSASNVEPAQNDVFLY